MSFISVFDVMGPNMIGPSSSHTAGAARIAYLAQKMINGPLAKVEFILYGSFARTYHGHGTDRALLGGIMGFSTDDMRIRNSFEIATENGLKYSFTPNEEETDIHPNTVDIIMTNTAGQEMTIRGESLGGGKVHITQINHVEVDFTGEYSAIIVVQKDVPGVVAWITSCLSDRRVNIAFMRLFRESKGHTAYTIVESDGKLPEEIADTIRQNEHVLDVRTDVIVFKEVFYMDFKNANELLTLCEEQNISISEVMRNREIITGECPAKEADQKMARVLEIMKEAARSPIEKPIRSMGGLIGGEAQKLAQHSASGQGLCGELLEKAITYAMATLETNASMGLIVASPTAGSAGIVPGLLLAFQEVYHFSDKEIQQVLFNAGAVGYLAMVLHLLWQRLPLLNLWVELLSNVWMPPQQSL